MRREAVLKSLTSNGSKRANLTIIIDIFISAQVETTGGGGLSPFALWLIVKEKRDFIVTIAVTLLPFWKYFAFLCSRVRTMVDVMAARVHEAYDGGSVRQSGSLHHQLSQIQLKKKERVTFNKESNLATLDHAIYQTKNSIYTSTALNKPQQRPCTGLSCLDCTPESRVSMRNRNT